MLQRLEEMDTQSIPEKGQGPREEHVERRCLYCLYGGFLAMVEADYHDRWGVEDTEEGKRPRCWKCLQG